MEKLLPQIAAMRMGTAYRVPVVIRQFETLFRVLSMKEVLERAHKVASHISGLPANARTQMNEHYFMARETLKMASTSDVGKEDMTVSDPMLDEMTIDEVMYMYRQYIDATDKVNPALEYFDNDTIKALVEDLKKKPDLKSALTELSFSQLASMALYSLTNNG